VLRPPNLDASSPPRRRSIATYTAYLEAQRAMDFLSDEGFPVERAAIVAEGLRIVEQVTGRLDYGRAALTGALNGGTLGAVVGLLLGLFSSGPAFGLLLRGLLVGLVYGAIAGLVGKAMTGGRRDFTSVTGMQAERYQVMVDEDVAAEAETVLARLR
jgi:hypothetical protein